MTAFVWSVESRSRSRWGRGSKKKERKGCRAREAQANCCQYVCNANKLYLIKGTRVTHTPRPLPRTNVLKRGCSCQAGPISLFIQPYSTLPSCCSSATTFSSCELLCIDDALEMPFDVLIEARFRLRLRVRPAPNTLHLPIRHIRLDAPLGNVCSRGEAWQRQRQRQLGAAAARATSPSTCRVPFELFVNM